MIDLKEHLIAVQNVDRTLELMPFVFARERDSGRVEVVWLEWSKENPEDVRPQHKSKCKYQTLEKYQMLTRAWLTIDGTNWPSFQAICQRSEGEIASVKCDDSGTHGWLWTIIPDHLTLTP